MTETEILSRRDGLGRGFGGPGKYVQRAGELDRLPVYIRSFGRRALILVDGFILDRLGERIVAALDADGIVREVLRFAGECCTDEIERVTGAAGKLGAEVVVGIGGGKTVDTAKCAAVGTSVPMIIVPTTASTDAPCSAIAVRYTPDGTLDAGLFLGRNPDVVVVDSAVVAAAPLRFLIAGMGDALSTWFEARACAEARLDNFIGERFPPTIGGLAIARACHETLMRDGRAAVAAARAGALTPAVEAIIEANTLLSGVGFENCGVSAAHGISDALAVLDPHHRLLHGEKVAFGVLCLLVLEGRSTAEISETAVFMRDVGLPVRLRDLFPENIGKAELEAVGRRALAPGASTWRIAGPLTVETVVSAILGADALGEAVSRMAASPARPRPDPDAPLVAGLPASAE